MKVAKADLGVISPTSSGIVTAVFTLRNEGAKPVTITRVQTSCGCTSAVVQAEGNASPAQAATLPSMSGPVTLAPGRTASVRLTLHTDALHAGPISKAAFVYTTDRPVGQPAARLSLTGALDPGVAPSRHVPAVAPETASQAADAPSALPPVGGPAPTFTLADAEGKTRALAEGKGRPIALFFFCGCSWCADMAKEWATLQQGHALTGTASMHPLTVIVYSGTAAEAKDLAKASGLDLGQTLLLCDPDLHVTQDLYHSEPCPRVFVLDGRGVVRYVNAGPDDKPREAPATVIAAKTLSALRAASSPVSSEPGKL
jgi:peroxiredoxin